MSEDESNKENDGLKETETKIDGKLEEQVRILQEENADLQDKYLRKHADFENYRKRMTKEKADAIVYANKEIIKKLLDVLDIFELAQKSSTENANIEAIMQGIAMTKDKMNATLKEFGLIKMDALNKEFNPEIHQAINMMEDESGKIEVPTVVEVYQDGYSLNDLVLRTATVQVVNPAKK